LLDPSGIQTRAIISSASKRRRIIFVPATNFTILNAD
jgi:hypothetical protein